MDPGFFPIVGQPRPDLAEEVNEMFRITLLLLILLLSCASLALSKTAQRKDDAKSGFSVRQPGRERAKQSFEDKERVSEPRMIPNRAMPYQAGSSPFAPTVCDHDLAEDMEFRQCIHSLLDRSDSLRAPTPDQSSK